MKTSIIKKVAGVVAVFALAVTATLTPLAAEPAYAQVDCKVPNAKDNCAQAGINKAKGDGVSGTLFGTDSIFTNVVNTLLFVIGAVSVVMLIWGGIRYTTSAGNSTAVTSAKNTIMYAIIGLVIAFLAFAIVNWVLGAL